MALLSSQALPGNDEQPMANLAAPLSVTATHKSEWVSFSEEMPCPSPLNGDKQEAVENSSSSSESSFEDHRKQDGETQEGPCLSELAGATKKVGDHVPPEDPFFVKPDLSSAISTWVQFEETPWNGSSPDCGQTADKNVLTSGTQGTHPLNSESSWTTHSENTSPSMAPSYTDVPSAVLEEVSSEGVSGAESVDNSSVQEDDEIDMETINRQSHSVSVNGHATTTTTARFPSWVTFEEDKDTLSPSQKGPTWKPEKSPAVVTSSTSCNVSESFRKRERPKSTLVDLHKVQKIDALSLRKPLSFTGSPFKATNPFLDESLKDVQPSPINPFSSFFEEREKRSRTTSLSSTQSTDQTDSLTLISQELDAVKFEDYRKRLSQADVLQQLKQLQFEDPDHLESPTLPDDDPIKSDELLGPSLTFVQPQPKVGWSMMMRIPEKKNIMSSRHWGPIYVKLTEVGFVQLFYEKGLEKPFREFKLENNHEVSEPKLQTYDENGRIHTVRIDHVTYTEKKKYQPKLSVTRTAEREQVIKLGTTSYEDFVSFIAAVQNALMNLPATVDLSRVGLNYTKEEITVDLRDEFYGILSRRYNKILQHSVVTHVYALSFLSGLADCRLGLNDVLIKGNEIVSRHDIMPTTTTKWIKLYDCQFHSSVDEELFHSSRMIMFNPLDACRFELMRFRTVFAEKTLPFTLRTAACVKGAEVEFQSWVVMSVGFSSNRDPLTQVPCENVMVRYPIPNEWVKNFRRDSVLGEKSLKAKVNRGASLGSTSMSGPEPAMRVTLGTAKYEHAYNAIVWRIGRLPDKNAASGQPHCFFCHLELGSDREVPSSFVRYVDVEFDMPATSASKAAVRSISVEDKADAKKWVNYSAHYSCKVEIEQKNSLNLELEGEETDSPRECAAQYNNSDLFHVFAAYRSCGPELKKARIGSVASEIKLSSISGISDSGRQYNSTEEHPKLYRSVIEDVINDVREMFLDEGVDEQVLMELKTLWENKLMQSKAVDGFHSEEQQLMLQAHHQQQQQQQHQQQLQQHHHPQQIQQQQPQQTVHHQSQTHVLIPAQQQAPQQQVIMPDSKLLQHMNPSGMSAAAAAATLAAGVGPVSQLFTQSGQILQVVRAANGAQYIIGPQQPVVLQQQVIPQMQPGGVQAPVIQQVLAPISGGIPQQTGVIIQPQQILFTGNKTQVIPTTVAAQTSAQGQITVTSQHQQQQAQPQQPLVLQVDGAGDTSSEEDEDEEEDYDDEEEEDKEKDGGEDGQVEEEPLNSEDDVSDEEGQELFDTENVVVCQYDKIHRSKNKWKFHLKDGIMNLNGRDYVFSKAIGDAEW
ncbi:stonin-2 [Microcaecilia unicolor]|uniref:Stonin-2 n=1 Tax=Microcaecilia unicolor TaxID=1415580 RepID=A0A6P7Z1D1_9AMPH|nr:stonin-2 [Microcaecilia unicolor]